MAVLLNDVNIQALVLSDIGLSSDTAAQANVLLWWAMYAEYKTRVRYLFVKRTAIEYAIGKIREDAVDGVVGGDTVDQSDRVKNLRIMIQSIDNQLTKYESEYVAELVIQEAVDESLPDSIQELQDFFMNAGTVAESAPFGVN